MTKKRHVLTVREREKLRLGRVQQGSYKVKVNEYWRKVWKWPSKQHLKDKTIDDFAVKFSSQLYRYGVTASDQRHIQNLKTLLDDVMADAST